MNHGISLTRVGAARAPRAVDVREMATQGIDTARFWDVPAASAFAFDPQQDVLAVLHATE